MVRPPQKRLDHCGQNLPPGIYPLSDEGGNLTGYKARWREEDAGGSSRHSAKSFSIEQTGSADAALAEASLYREQALKVVRIEGSVLRGDPAERMSVNELFAEWCVGRGPDLSERYCEKVARCIGAPRVADAVFGAIASTRRPTTAAETTSAAVWKRGQPSRCPCPASAPAGRHRCSARGR
jgi:hypothetical protein